MGIIYLATDFGIQDHYVALMKSRILLSNPRANIIDLSHNLPVYDIEFASWFLYFSFFQLEEPCFICAVIDPGVGTNRKAIIVQIGKRYIVAPDNGLLTVILNDIKSDFKFFEIRLFQLKKIYEETIKQYNIKLNYKISNTFHGRDIFAPAIGLISRSTEYISSFCKPISGIQKFNIISPVYWDFENQTEVKGKIVYYDQFGNLFTNIKILNMNPHDNLQLQIFEKNQKIKEINNMAKTFSDLPENQFLFYSGSTEFIEIAKNQGSALGEWKDFTRIRNFDIIIKKKSCM